MAPARTEAIRDWVFNAALPWWAENGVDRVHGGFVEQVTGSGQDAGVPFKRTRVTARQIYVFSHGHVLGFPGSLDIAAHGLHFLTQKTWLGQTKGFARTLTRTGDLLDPTPDLYDHAFVLFALAWHYKASEDIVSRDWMHRTLDYVEGHLRLAGGQGFLHETPARGWRQQNPHMHLTEASLLAHEATGDKRFSDLCGELVDLFRTRFFDPFSGTLGEYFSMDLERAPAPEGHIVEPGHQFEWAWILNQCRKQLDMNVSQQILALADFAEKHGVDPATGVTWNSVGQDGRPIDRASRTWPNCERIKAAIALHELDGRDTSAMAAGSADLLFQRHLARSPAGTWTDRFDARGAPVQENIPASTFYHVLLAFAEVMRTGCI